MFKSGLVSISFRDLEVEKILQMCKKAQVDCIEWGGDKHVVHGDLALARKVASRSADAGIEIAAYGSYYIAAFSETPVEKKPAYATSFQAVLDSALELGTNTIRVWAGSGVRSAEVSEERRKEIVDDLLRIGAMAAPHDIKIGLEFHGGTLTDTNESAFRLKQELGDESNVYFYWQPPVNYDDAQCMAGIKGLAPRICNIHAFQWTQGDDGKTIKQLLADGEARWVNFLGEIAKDGSDHAVMLEFIADNSEENFYKDAATLKRITAAV